MKTFFTKYWWVLLLIALAIIAYLQRNWIMAFFGKGNGLSGTDVPPSESCASPEGIVQRAALKEGEGCPKMLYPLILDAKEMKIPRTTIENLSCPEELPWIRNQEGFIRQGPWYLNYEKENVCYYINKKYKFPS